MKYSISEVLKKADSMPTKAEKIMILRQELTPAMRDIFTAAFDKRVKWLLPEGPVPYEPNKLVDLEGMLYQQTRTFYLYVAIDGQPQAPDLTQFKREHSFIQLLECLDKADADLMMHVKDGKLPYESITADLVLEAFPGMFVKKPTPKTSVYDAVTAALPVKRGRGRPRKVHVENAKST